MAHGRVKSNDVLYQSWVVQVQDKHIKKIICLKLAIHLVIMDLWRWVLTKQSHNGLWGSKLKSSRSNNDQVKHSGLTRAWSIIIKINRNDQGKGMSLRGFPFTGLKVFVGRPGYRIDSRTIKRGFQLGNLITSSILCIVFISLSCCFLLFICMRFLCLFLAFQQVQVHRKRNPNASPIAF
jgi:hypothetical protein